MSASIQAIFSSFLLVAASEMGDKTQLLALTLAARFRRPWPIMGGILAATLLNHGLASSVGALVAAQVPPRAMALALGVGFVAFGVWTLRPDTLDETDGRARFGPFLTTTFLFFLAEMGDKTQLATVALAAEFRSVGLVTAGTTLGMLVSDGLAVFSGEWLSRRVPMQRVRTVAAGLFFLFGALSLWTAARGA